MEKGGAPSKKKKKSLRGKGYRKSHSQRRERNNLNPGGKNNKIVREGETQGKEKKPLKFKKESITKRNRTKKEKPGTNL